MLAISFIDKFLEGFQRLDINHLLLVGITALQLAAKVNENCVFTLETAEVECDGLYSQASIRRCEESLLHLLEFQTNIPTAFEIAQYLLYLSNDEFDFSIILAHSSIAMLELLIGNSLPNVALINF